MITFAKGNLLESDAEALVNTVNTVGVMGKGIALMFKERFARNFQLYADACKSKRVKTGKMFVTEVGELNGPHWIVNFPTKDHWRSPSKLEWITEGLLDLRKFLIENKVKSIAIPPLGAGNGGLNWQDVRLEIERLLADLPNTQVLVFEPTSAYQNIAKRDGVEKLTPARALIAELVRRYWVLGMECSLLEIQKLAWLLERNIKIQQLKDPLDLQFVAHKYGPFASRLTHLLNNLDGSYLHCDRRISDAGPLDVIWFDEKRADFLKAYLASEAKDYLQVLEDTTAQIDGFESPFGLELLATVGWILDNEDVTASPGKIREQLKLWPSGTADRKLRLFDTRSISHALNRMKNDTLVDAH